MRTLRLMAAGATLACLAAPALAEEGEKGGSIMGSGTNWNAIWAVGIFMVLLIILGRFAWRPILRAVEQREKAIADALATAQAQQAQSQQLLAEYQIRLQKADDEAARRLDEARRDALEAREKILLAARHEADEVAKRATAEISSAKQSALNELYAFAGDLATQVASRILRKELDPAGQQRLIDESLEQIRQKAGKKP